MASLSFDGIDALADSITQFEREFDDDTLGDEILTAGGEIAVGEWQRALDSAGHVDSGLLKSKVKAQLHAKDRKVTIYPRGSHPEHTDGKGGRIRLAAIAYILHYGHGRAVGSRFVTKAENRISQRFPEKAQAILDKKLEEKGLV